MEAKDWVDLVNELGPVIGIVAVVIGALITGWFQARVSRKQATDAHESQLKLLQEAHRQTLETMALQHDREADQRTKQFAESDKADRLVVVEYVDLLLPRLIDAASIGYLGPNNRDQEELRRYQSLQQFMTQDAIDPAHPEKNLGLRMAFLVFQLTAAMRIALNARWLRPLTDVQTRFLSHWEDHLEPVFCSGRYPGKEVLYREQAEIIVEEMLIAPGATKVTRPLNWKEFCDKCESSPVLRELAEQVADRLRFIFVETNSLPPRRAMQCRLAILALYLVQISKDAGNDSWTRREESLWRIAREWFAWEAGQGQNPRWFVFRFGDVAELQQADA